jgi:hypothetical protein
LTFLKGVAIFVYHLFSPRLTDVCIEFPAAWNLTGADKIGDEDEDDSNSEDSEEETNDIAQQAKPPGPSIAYREFLQFLELGCSGSPSQGYPAIVIILSTIPSPVRSNAHTCEYACINILGLIDRFLCLSRVFSPLSGRQLMVVL